MNKLSFQIIREDIAPTIEKIDTFEFISGEKRTLALQLLNCYNQESFLVPLAQTVTLCLPTADTNAPIQKAMILDTLDRSVATAELSVENTQNMISGQILIVVSDDSDAVKATGTIDIIDNSFSPGDRVTINGTNLIFNVDWFAGGNTDASATNLAAAIDALNGMSAPAVASQITITADAFGESGNGITMSSLDTGNLNFTLSGNTLEGGSFGTEVMKALRKSILVRNKG